MKIMLCHPSKDEIQNMRVSLKGTFPFSQLAICYNLTDAYHVAEHDNPDYLILAPEFALSPDFEMLGALMKIMRIEGVWWNMPRSQLAATIDFGFQYYDPNNPQIDPKKHLRTPDRPPSNTHGNSSPTTSQHRHDPQSVILLGASTGGVEALTQTLRHLSDSTPPTLVVQHTGENFTRSLTRLLNGVTQASVLQAQDGMPLEQGTVYLSPSADHHICMRTNGRFQIGLVASDHVSGHRPSVDVLFQSAVPNARHTVAALLTGMGRDGADGLLALRNAGAHTITQNQATSVVYGMPRVATEIGAAKEQLPLNEIGPALVTASRKKVRA